jgi:hypothetical protein
VHISAIPGETAQRSNWPSCQDTRSGLTSFVDVGMSTLEIDEIALLDRSQSLLVAIESVPLGSRVITENPRHEDYDHSLPIPDEANWVQVQMQVKRNDGSLVDAQLLRPRRWVDERGLTVGSLISMSLSELQIDGEAEITALLTCPPLANGEGEVVTGRFVTRQVEQTVSITFSNGETLEATEVHLVWSPEKNDWLPISEFVVGDIVLSRDGIISIVGMQIRHRPQPVYNLEVRGEHVYEVTNAGILVHNTSSLSNAPLADSHKLTWDLYGPKVGDLGSGAEISGVEFAIPKGTKLSFLEQSLYGQTEGKVIGDLIESGKLGPGTILAMKGQLKPCGPCQFIMKSTSAIFKMTIDYVDSSGNTWTWINGMLQKA